MGRLTDIAQDSVTSIGQRAIALWRELGEMTLLFGAMLRKLPELDRSELLRQLYRMGNRSVPIVCATALFAGAIMVIQLGVFVRRFNAGGILGWGAGYTIFREVGPVLIALIFSGRVGSNNTAELASMTVTEQIDGLRALCIHPVAYLVAPRVLAMTICLVCLVVLGNLVALYGGAGFAMLLLDIEFSTLYYSLVENLGWPDFAHGVAKATIFGFSIGITSCHFGMNVRGGAAGVGRAVNASVVAGALSIVLFDFFMTYGLS